MNIHQPPFSDALAAEYVLGTLQGQARRRFEQLLRAHPNLREAVADWEQRLNRLVVASPPVAPPATVWRDLERRLFPAPARLPWWDSLAFWRGLALAGILALILVIVPPLAVPPPADAAFATIRGQQQEVLWTVAQAADGRLHVSNLRPMTLPADQRCLLWLKMGDEPPVMLGMLPDDGSAKTLSMPVSLAHSAQDGELWVTMQPIAHVTPPTRPIYQARWQAL